MIAEGRAIRHGAANIDYAMGKEMAEVVKINSLPDNIEPLAMWSRMMQLQHYFGKDSHSAHPLKDTALAFEISPTSEESKDWTIDNWQRFLAEWINVFDSITSVPDKPRVKLKPTNLKNSQYVAALHRDSKSGILHIHLLANRVDNMGNTNDVSFIGLRAAHAANIMNQRRGWKQSADIHEEHLAQINRDCDEILRGMTSFSLDTYFIELEKRGYKVKPQKDEKGQVKAYSVFMGNSKFIASSLGYSRNLTVSRIENTWAKMHARAKTQTQPEVKMPAIMPVTPRKYSNSSVTEIKLNTQRIPQRPVGYKVIDVEGKKYEVVIPQEANQVFHSELELPDATTASEMLHLMNVAALLFAGYVDAATTIVESHGGGGGISSGWGRDDDENDCKWAHRCAQKANWLFKPMRRQRRF